MRPPRRYDAPAHNNRHAHYRTGEVGAADSLAIKYTEIPSKTAAPPSQLERQDLLRYAADLGLDVKRFASGLAGAVHRPRVQEDFRSGVRSGVNGTPTFFINGARFDGAWDEAGLLAALETA